MSQEQPRLMGFKDGNVPGYAGIIPKGTSKLTYHEVSKPYQELVAAVRRLHWPSPNRDPACDCYDGLQGCPTIAAIDALGFRPSVEPK